ncbi:HAD family hydrolase [Vannielia litorea]|uniref:phosphoglycolate phosphatase n=1 Tax=Vannielia litorea TaxID=1217970 RepID=A0A1N6FVA5_9RHOB|nr:HAD family hydrolase [Vannielia litorea]SIN99162.1 phosphoglycolate phosphatase [Vannielia litorea]
MNLKGLLFDKDGTLFDYQKSWGSFTLGFIDDLASGDAVLARRLAAAMGIDPGTARFAPDSPIVAGTPEEVMCTVLPFMPGWSAQALTDRLNAAAAKAPQVPATELAPLLCDLRNKGFALGVATNDAEVAAREHIEAAGIGGAFDFLAGYDSGHGAKPDPGMCLAFARATNLNPGDCAMIGDSLHDLTAGRAAGMVCIAVCTGIAPAKEFAPFADVVLPDIGHIPGWLTGR